MKPTLSETSPGEPLSNKQVEDLTADDLLPEYDLDYAKARPNRFAARLAQTRTVELEADVATVFTTQAAVNAVLRALIQTMPQNSDRKPT